MFYKSITFCIYAGRSVTLVINVTLVIGKVDSVAGEVAVEEVAEVDVAEAGSIDSENANSTDTPEVRKRM